jgi:hypothetical protein
MVDPKRHDDGQADSGSERPTKRARMSAEPSNEHGRVLGDKLVENVNGGEDIDEDDEEETPYQEETRPSDLYLDTVCSSSPCNTFLINCLLLDQSCYSRL